MGKYIYQEIPITTELAQNQWEWEYRLVLHEFMSLSGFFVVDMGQNSKVSYLKMPRVVPLASSSDLRLMLFKCDKLHAQRATSKAWVSPRQEIILAPANKPTTRPKKAFLSLGRHFMSLWYSKNQNRLQTTRIHIFQQIYFIYWDDDVRGSILQTPLCWYKAAVYDIRVFDVPIPSNIRQATKNMRQLASHGYSRTMATQIPRDGKGYPVGWREVIWKNIADRVFHNYMGL